MGQPDPTKEPNSTYDYTYGFNSAAIGAWILFPQAPFTSSVLSLAFINYYKTILNPYFVTNGSPDPTYDQNAATILASTKLSIGGALSQTLLQLTQLAPGIKTGTLTDTMVASFETACLNGALSSTPGIIYQSLGGQCSYTGCPYPGSIFMTVSCFKDPCNQNIVTAFNNLLAMSIQYDGTITNKNSPGMVLYALNQLAAAIIAYNALTFQDGYLVALQLYLNTQTGGITTTGTDLVSYANTQKAASTALGSLANAIAQLSTYTGNAEPYGPNTFTNLLMYIMYEIWGVYSDPTSNDYINYINGTGGSSNTYCTNLAPCCLIDPVPDSCYIGGHECTVFYSCPG